MKRLIVYPVIASIFLAGCAAPKPKTVDGSNRVPVNKIIPPAKDQGQVEHGDKQRS